MKLMKYTALALFFGASTVWAADYTLGQITVTQPSTFETAKNTKVGGGYMTITNDSKTDDRLVEVRVEGIPRIELHLSATDENGVATMTKQDGIDVPSGETVTLMPGGLHVMFMGLGDNPFELGDQVDATLVFENAGEMDVTFDVRARTASDHSGMKMSD
ncbi:copper chaperone PCu(A)C [Sulfitobacter sp. S223]|uniref:copper chaperone PCu(A)C n=1 Tax=Sulfitobacter sp. S223 TaxID=2867023 RepID=UPI0021A4A8ED|nr:copper chaperone PCu(A)C [Sulfitobacter sp. S223]UWR26994.1 copper chaperone PCu(A)C [Sulfitobacter sp. S223]